MANLAVQPWVEGPNFISVGIAGGALQFFGTAAHCPRPRIQRAFKPLMNDVMAHQLPFDKSFQGQKAIISMSMSRWNYAMYLQMAQTTQGGDPGSLNFGSLGTLMLFEGFAMNIGIQFPYNAIAAFSAMPKGYIFYGCTMESDDLMEEGGTEGQILNLTFEATSAYNPATGGNALYSVNSNFPQGY